jgi:hypothetical protein
MQYLDQVAEDEMVLAFLQAEIDSARFGHIYRQILVNSRLQRESLIDHPDKRSAPDNALRRQLLTQVRGFGDRTLLFLKFPLDVAWRRATIGPADFSTLKYTNDRNWVQISGGSRNVIDGARNIESFPDGNDVKENIKVVVQDFRAGKRYPPNYWRGGS